MDGEHVGPGHGRREHAGLGVHPAPEVGLGACECEVLLAAHVVVLGPERVKVDGERLRHEVPQQRVFLQHLVGQVLDSIRTSLQVIGQLLSKLIDPFVGVVVIPVNVSLA